MTVRAWRGAIYLLKSLLSGIATVLALPVLVHPRLARGWADLHRRRAGALLGVLPAPRPAATSTVRAAWADPGSRRDLLWLPVHAATGVTAGLAALLCLGNVVVAAVAVALWWAFEWDERPRLFIDVPVPDWTTALTLGPLQLVLLVAVAYLVFPPVARGHARLCLAVLTPSTVEQLTDRVAVLTRTRADVLDAHGAELRRIERDLHDGTQARLVAIAMRLAVARRRLSGDPADQQFVAGLLREAHEGTEEAMRELREVLRTVYPPILADRGLAGALHAVTARCTVPTTLDLGELGRVPAAVEAVVYFAVAEALTNTVRHSHASGAGVTLTRAGDRLCVVVTDNGAGGADDRRGTGLVGLRRRVHALDGTVDVDSPPGGPTTITLELPCG
ncbi:sensor histidine kinase [Dactylosporangium sp. NBC_01737]|uniref:sensor histidine kinase n=1 Tax=Dactylosporangium sp. NBC_01737 TaxID=2975959 RepID=UPI002E10E6EB|nr:sensor histidine kinase [Dactylosporangium sp. NBC_01737]